MEDNLYEALFIEGLTAGVFGISLVRDPAIMVEALSFSKNKPKSKDIELLRFSDDKQVMISPVLIPEQRIYRNEIGVDKEEGYVTLSKETIYDLQLQFFKEQYNHNSSLEHNTQLEDIFVFESWIIEDSKNDKANALGYNLPAGTWMASIKINNSDIWESVKQGLIKGFSIDGELLTNKKEDFKMKKNVLKAKFSKLIKAKFEGEKKEFELSDGKKVYASDLTVGEKLYDENDELLVDFKFEYDGKEYYTDAEGYINEVESIDTLEMSDEDIEAVIEEAMEEIEVNFVERIAELEAENAELKLKIAELEGIKEEVEAEVLEMKRNKPASRGVQTKRVAQKETVAFSKNMTFLKGLRK